MLAAGRVPVGDADEDQDVVGEPLRDLLHACLVPRRRAEVDQVKGRAAVGADPGRVDRVASGEQARAEQVLRPAQHCGLLFEQPAGPVHRRAARGRQPLVQGERDQGQQRLAVNELRGRPARPHIQDHLGDPLRIAGVGQDALAAQALPLADQPLLLEPAAGRLGTAPGADESAAQLHGLVALAAGPVQVPELAQHRGVAAAPVEVAAEGVHGLLDAAQRGVQLAEAALHLGVGFGRAADLVEQLGRGRRLARVGEDARGAQWILAGEGDAPGLLDLAGGEVRLQQVIGELRRRLVDQSDDRLEVLDRLLVHADLTVNLGAPVEQARVVGPPLELHREQVQGAAEFALGDVQVDEQERRRQVEGTLRDLTLQGVQLELDPALADHQLVERDQCVAAHVPRSIPVRRAQVLVGLGEAEVLEAQPGQAQVTHRVHSAKLEGAPQDLDGPVRPPQLREGLAGRFEGLGVLRFGVDERLELGARLGDASVAGVQLGTLEAPLARTRRVPGDQLGQLGQGLPMILLAHEQGDQPFAGRSVVRAAREEVLEQLPRTTAVAQVVEQGDRDQERAAVPLLAGELGLLLGRDGHRRLGAVGVHESTQRAVTHAEVGRAPDQLAQLLAPLEAAAQLDQQQRDLEGQALIPREELARPPPGCLRPGGEAELLLQRAELLEGARTRDLRLRGDEPVAGLLALPLASQVARQVGVAADVRRSPAQGLFVEGQGTRVVAPDRVATGDPRELLGLDARVREQELPLVAGGLEPTLLRQGLGQLVAQLPVVLVHGQGSLQDGDPLRRSSVAARELEPTTHEGAVARVAPGSGHQDRDRLLGLTGGQVRARQALGHVEVAGVEGLGPGELLAPAEQRATPAVQLGHAIEQLVGQPVSALQERERLLVGGHGGGRVELALVQLPEGSQDPRAQDGVGAGQLLGDPVVGDGLPAQASAGAELGHLEAHLDRVGRVLGQAPQGGCRCLPLPEQQLGLGQLAQGLLPLEARGQVLDRGREVTSRRAGLPGLEVQSADEQVSLRPGIPEPFEQLEGPGTVSAAVVEPGEENDIRLLAPRRSLLVALDPLGEAALGEQRLDQVGEDLVVVGPHGQVPGPRREGVLDVSAFDGRVVLGWGREGETEASEQRGQEEAHEFRSERTQAAMGCREAPRRPLGPWS